MISINAKKMMCMLIKFGTVEFQATPPEIQHDNLSIPCRVCGEHWGTHRGGNISGFTLCPRDSVDKITGYMDATIKRAKGD